MSLLEATGVTVRYQGHDDAGRRQLWAAVDGVSLTVGEGERVGIVGESGSGKTTFGKGLLGMEPLAEGTVLFRGRPVDKMKGAELMAFRQAAQMVFQDPMGSLNPRMTIGAALGEVLMVHKLTTKDDRPARLNELLQQVGLDNGYIRRYPHEFSGGQRQRIGIARALALNPALLVADEPVSALDVSVQAQILNLIRDLSEARGMAVLLVAHDLAVVNYVCQRVLIMYKGQMVEEGSAQEVFRNPRHPYTQLLKASVPDPDDVGRQGDVASVPGAGGDLLKVNSSSGCAFAPRCSQAIGKCFSEKPARHDAGGRFVRCHLVK